MPQFDRHFTLAQANAIIPWVRSIFGAIHRLVRELDASAGAPLDAVGPYPLPPLGPAPQDAGNGNGNGNGNGHGHEPPTPSPADWAHLNRKQKGELINQLLHGIMAAGILIQDVERGLVDFPAWRNGQEVLLCYELRDGDRIQAWHSLNGGYAGREPLDDEFGEQ